MTDQPPATQVPKKKAKPVIEVPADVSTASLIVKAAVVGVLGVAPVSSVSWSLLQKTFLKQAGSGKFGLNLGKKLGLDHALVALPETEADTEVLFAAIESACAELIASNLPIVLQKISAKDAEQMGLSVIDGEVVNLMKKNPTLEIQVAVIPGYVAAVVPSTPLASTAALTSLQIDRSQSSVTTGARKAEVTIKFGGETSTEESNKAATVGTLPIEGLTEQNFRFAIGQELFSHQQQAAQENQEAQNAQEDAAAAAKLAGEEMVVNVEEVKGKIDYKKLVQQFGSTLITDDVLKRLEAVAAQRNVVLHRFLRRGIFFSHRDLEPLLSNCFEKEPRKPLYLYTGRGPSSDSMHLGHLVPFLFTKWLQDALGVPLVIQMTDDEKFIFKGNYDDQEGDNLDHFAKLTVENAKDIIACGFDYEKTFLFSDLDYVGHMYPNIVRIWKAVTTNTINGIFGFDGSSNIGKIAFPAIQAAPSFASSFPVVLEADRDSDMVCLIPCAIDQDPYFRMTRDVAHKLVNKSHSLAGKPALIHSKFFPPLQGAEGKMSSSDQNSAIFLTDTPEDIERKIKSYAFSGGQETSAKQRELGADLEIDVAYQWLTFFLESDEELAKIGQDYSTGSGEYWATGKVKARLIEILQNLVAEHQERRAKITDAEVQKWMEPRSIL